MKILLISLLLFCLACGAERPFGIYANGTRLYDHETSTWPEHYLIADRPMITILKTMFRVEDYRFSYHFPGHEDWISLSPQIYHRAANHFEVTFEEHVPQGVVLKVAYLEQRFIALWGEPRATAEAVAKDQDLSFETRIRLLMEYNRFFIDQPVIKLLGDLRFAQETTAANTVQYLDEFPRGGDISRIASYSEHLAVAGTEAHFRRLFDKSGRERIKALEAFDKAPNLYGEQIAHMLLVARQAWDDDVFKQAMNLSGIAQKRALEDYLHDFPVGANRSQAIAALATLAEGLDEPRFRAAVSQPNLDVKIRLLNKYLVEFSRGVFVVEARTALRTAYKERDQTSFESAKYQKGWRKLESLENYLRIFPDGEWRLEARRLLEDVRAELSESVYKQLKETKRPLDRLSLARSYLERFPNGRHQTYVKAHWGAAREEIAAKALAEAQASKTRAERRKALQIIVETYFDLDIGEEAAVLLAKLNSGEL